MNRTGTKRGGFRGGQRVKAAAAAGGKDQPCGNMWHCMDACLDAKGHIDADCYNNCEPCITADPFPSD